MLPSPFLIQNNESYAHWRLNKLANTPDYREHPEKYFIDIEDATQLTTHEQHLLLNACKQNSMALYRFTHVADNCKQHVHQFAKQLGLKRLDNNLCADADSLTSITQTRHPGQHDYIPYSNKRLSWHTDGYYNRPARQINGMLLHCAIPASEGGESMLMDHEIVYILLREENPDWIAALMQPDAMTIPANILEGKVIRDAQTGPVFSINPSGQLHMRYSARQRNIEWKQNAHILEAVDFMNHLWEDASSGNVPYLLKYTLQSGEGVICNNVLHCRSAFVDSDDTDKKRLLYRGRYYDRVNDISNNQAR